MKRTLKLLDSLTLKVEKLVNQHEAFNQKKTEIINQVEDLRITLDNKEKENKQLKEQIRMIGVSGSVKSFNGSENARSKINELVREIDNCIELINK